MAEQEENVIDNGEEISPEDLAEARSMGWSDKDKWRGPEEDWVDARTFLERGRKVLPIVTAHNRELRGQVGAQAQQIEEMNAQMRAMKATLDALDEEATETRKVTAAQRREDLKTQLVQASRDGEHERVAELTDQIAQLGRPQDDAPDDDDTDTTQTRSQPPHPEVVQWFKDNPDFAKDHRRSALGNAIILEMRQNGDKRVGKEILDEVREEVEKVLGGKSGGGTSRVSGGNGGTGRRGGPTGGGKTFADLPKDAQDAARHQAKRFVGEGKRYKDEASWFKAYTSKYFAQGE